MGEGLQRYRNILSNRNYRYLWIGQSASELGNAISRIALILLVYHLSGSPSAVALLMLVQTLPVLLLGMFTGIFLERWDRRQVMLVMDLLRAGLVAGIPFCDQLYPIYLLSFWIAIGNIFFLPARDGIIPDLVERSRLALANSFIAISMGLVMVIGPAIGGGLTGFWGFHIAFFIDAFTFLVSAYYVWKIRSPLPKRPNPPVSVNAIFREIREGFRFLHHHPHVELIAYLVFFTMIAIGLLFPLLPDFNEQFLGGTDFTFGLITSFYGLGGLLGGPVGEWMSRHWRRGKIIYYLLIIDSLIFMGFSVVSWLPGSLFLIALWGINGFAWWVVYWAWLQEIIPENFRGRLFTFMHQLEHAGMIVAFALALFVGDYFPVWQIFLAAACFYLWVVLLLSRHRGFSHLVGR